MSAAIQHIDYAQLSMNDLIELQDRADAALLARFEHIVALLSLDLSGSAAQLVKAASTGTGTGSSALIQRCRSLIEPHVKEAGGTVYAVTPTRIDMSFPGIQEALDATYAMAEAIIDYNYKAKRDELIVPRYGMHYGTALSDGTMIVGEAARVVEKISGAAEGNLVWLSDAAGQQTSTLVRASFRPVPNADIISRGKRLTIFWMAVRATETVPESVLIENTGKEHPLPKQDIISFGRLDKLPDGTPANEICLTLPDRDAQLSISRWHFELRRTPRGGYVVRGLSGQHTEVDGKPVKRGEEAPVQSETTVHLAGKVHLRFTSRAVAASTRVAMTYKA